MYVLMGSDPDEELCLEDDPFLGGGYAMDINDIIGAPTASATTAPTIVAAAPKSERQTVAFGAETTPIDVSALKQEMEFTEYVMAGETMATSSASAATSPRHRRAVVKPEPLQFVAASPGQCERRIDEDDVVDDRHDDEERIDDTTDDSADGYNQSPELDHIMSDHNYFNQTTNGAMNGANGGSEANHSDSADVDSPPESQTQESREPESPGLVAATDQPTTPSLTDLLLAVQHTLAVGSPVYDTCRDMLSLVTSLVLDYSNVNTAVLQTIADQVRLLRGQRVDSSVDGTAQTDSAEPVGSSQESTQTPDMLPASPPPFVAAPELDAGTNTALQRLQAFGNGVHERNEQLAADVRREAPEDRLSVLASFVGSLEMEFRARVHEFKLAAGLTDIESIAGTAAESPSRRQRALSSECMEKLVYPESEEDDDDDNDADEAQSAVPSSPSSQTPSSPPAVTTTDDAQPPPTEAGASIKAERLASPQTPPPHPIGSGLSFIEEPLAYPPLNVFAGDDDPTPPMQAMADRLLDDEEDIVAAAADEPKSPCSEPMNTTDDTPPTVATEPVREEDDDDVVADKDDGEDCAGFVIDNISI